MSTDYWATVVFGVKVPRGLLIDSDVKGIPACQCKIDRAELIKTGAKYCPLCGKPLLRVVTVETPKPGVPKELYSGDKLFDKWPVLIERETRTPHVYIGIFEMTVDVQMGTAISKTENDVQRAFQDIDEFTEDMEKLGIDGDLYPIKLWLVNHFS